MELLLATHNRGKRREYERMFAGLSLTLLTLDDAGITHDVEETGTTFEENALLKARTYGEMSGRPTLADDSGLSVDALDGFPGVHSARWHGPSDADRIQALLEKMKAVPWERRQAHFVCVAALVLPDGYSITREGEVTGRLLFAQRGSGGFGYDPIFYVESAGRTMAELTREEKNNLSHRGRAARAIRPEIERILGE